MTLIRLGADGCIEQAYRVADKQQLLEDLAAEDGLLAAWTGEYRTDVFWVDDVGAVRERDLARVGSSGAVLRG